MLDHYREAMLSRDYDAMLSFWSESPDFVFAGDGRILGGFEAWKAEITRYYKQTRSWEQWDWQSVHIVALEETAASTTVEFRFRWIDSDGKTQNSRGAWTYVFVKSGAFLESNPHKWYSCRVVNIPREPPNTTHPSSPQLPALKS